MDPKPGDIVRAKHNGLRGEVLEVAAGGARLRYEPGGPFGDRGRKLGVWEHLVDLEPVVTLGPATRADLLELDAVPEPVGDIARCPVHGRAGFCNELAWFADGVLPDEYPTREAVGQALRDRHIDLSEVRLSTAKCGWTSDA